MRFPGALTLVCALLCSCADSAPTSSVGAESVTLEEAHGLSESAIGDCMREQGFDYQQRTFMPAPESVAESRLFMADAESIGYRGAEFALVPALAHIGAPTVAMSQAQMKEYAIALTGFDLSVAEPSEGELQGCWAAGAAVESDLTIRPDSADGLDPLSRNDVEAEFFERLYATPGFSAFEQSWAACMSDTGQPIITDPSPTFVAPNALQRHFNAMQREAQTLMEMRLYTLLDGLDETWTYTVEDLRPDVVDTAWLDFVTSTDDEMAALLEKERAAATADAECRRLQRPLVQSEIEEVLLQMGLAD